MKSLMRSRRLSQRRTDNPGLIGKAEAPHIERRGYQLRGGLQPNGKYAAGARLFIWAVA